MGGGRGRWRRRGGERSMYIIKLFDFFYRIINFIAKFTYKKALLFYMSYKKYKKS